MAVGLIMTVRFGEHGSGASLPRWVMPAIWVVSGSVAAVSLFGLATAAVLAVLYHRRREQLKAEIAQALTEMQHRAARREK